MIKLKRELIKRKEIKLENVRANQYLSTIGRYPLYALLLVLDEYEEDQYFEECAHIKKAIDLYNKEYEEEMGEDISSLLPTSLKEYESEAFQATLRKVDLLVVTREYAQDKAEIIKSKIPVNGKV